MGLEKDVNFGSKTVTSHASWAEVHNASNLLQWLPEEDIEPNFKTTHTSEQEEVSAVSAGEVENAAALPFSQCSAAQGQAPFKYDTLEERHTEGCELTS